MYDIRYGFILWVAPPIAPIAHNTITLHKNARGIRLDYGGARFTTRLS